MKRKATSFLFLLASLPLTLGACRSTASEVASDVEDLIFHREYSKAVEVAAREHRANPNDEAKLETWKRASIALLIDRARRLTFQDQDLEALATLTEAEAIDPDQVDLRAWIHKTSHKIADRLFSEGSEAESEGDLETAHERYESVLRFVPDDGNARRGLARVLLLRNYHQGLGDGYYNDGVRALADYFLAHSYSRFNYAGKYQPDEDRVTDRRAQVRKMLAGQRVTIAMTLEQDELYAAARNEYRLVLLLEDDNATAIDGLARMQIEVKARELLRRADMHIRKGHFAAAEADLTAGEAQTVLQKELFQGKRDGIQEARMERAYRAALTLEKDYRYEEAAESYGELLEIAEFYRDARTRRDTMEEYVVRATDLSAKAKAASTEEARLEYLLEIEVFWPEYSGLQAQLKALRPK